MVNTRQLDAERSTRSSRCPWSPSSFSTLRGESTHANASAPSFQSTGPEWASASCFWKGGVHPSPPLLTPRAVLHGDQETCAGSIQSRRQRQTQMAGLGWGGSDTRSSGPLWLLGHLSWGMSGGLFQGIDNLFEDVRAVISYLLENGVGELLQLCIVPFNFL